MVVDTLSSYKRIVVKVGSSLLVDGEQHQLKTSFLQMLAAELAALRDQHHDIILVSSGAIALGRDQIALSSRWQLRHAQAAAAVGQIALAGAWTEALKKQGLVAAQILLTMDDTENRRRYLNARDTLGTLLESHIIPIINENDTVATQEIRFGDNDRLAARVAAMMEADLLVLLSDVDGLYDRPPHQQNAQHIPLVESITKDVQCMAGASQSGLGSGGMMTKIDAGVIATSSGCAMIIASGLMPQPLSYLQQGGQHTLFLPQTDALSARHAWILGSLRQHGWIKMDQGASDAIIQGRSLLAVGVTEVNGDFERGDSIRLLGPEGQLLAVGLAGYDAQDMRRIMGKQSQDIETILGPGERGALVHRDHLVCKV